MKKPLRAPNKMPVSLVNGDKLVQLLIKYGVGVKKQDLFMLSIDDSYFQNFSTEEMHHRPKRVDHLASSEELTGMLKHWIFFLPDSEGK